MQKQFVHRGHFNQWKEAMSHKAGDLLVKLW